MNSGVDIESYPRAKKIKQQKYYIYTTLNKLHDTWIIGNDMHCKSQNKIPTRDEGMVPKNAKLPAKRL